MSLVGKVFRQRKLLALSARAAETHFVGQAKTPEIHSKHKRLQPLYDLWPEVGEYSYIAPNATVAGEVYIDDYVSIWDRAVIRGDLNAVRIFHMAAIKENVSISTVSSLQTGIPSFTSIGPFTVVQPGCTLVSCTIGSQVMIGARTVVLEGAKIEDESIIGPDSVVPPGRLIPSHQLWAGNPVRYVRDLTKAEIWTVKVLANEK